VVTVSITTEQRYRQPSFLDPFGIFGQPFSRDQEPETIEQDIGSGFVIDGKNGFIVTNRHVVSNTSAKYRIITKDDKEYEVERIYRDPANDLAIVKVDAELPALELGDSEKLKVGQFVIAIGTALGEFRHTVTTGVISGLGRGIEAGGGFGSAVERLDNVIQTDAAINPGNSGGPLLNSAGQVIGVNVAVAQSGQNIGFAIPINVVKESLKNFNETGQFDRPFIGVRYTMITREMALQSRMPEGAYIREVVRRSPADVAGIEEGDIIIKINGKDVLEKDGGLAAIINTLKIGQKVPVEFDRDGEIIQVEVTLKAADE
jgi:serine protease Do